MTKPETRVHAVVMLAALASTAAVVAACAYEATSTGTDTALWAIVATAAVLCGGALLWALAWAWYAADELTALRLELHTGLTRERDRTDLRLSMHAGRIDDLARQLSRLERRLADMERATSNRERTFA